jgi:hypothetical protein
MVLPFCQRRHTSSYNQQVAKTNFNKIIDHLHKTNANFHSYNPRHLRTYKTVIRNLHLSNLSYDIINALAEFGHSVKFIYNV